MWVFIYGYLSLMKPSLFSSLVINFKHKDETFHDFDFKCSYYDIDFIYKPNMYEVYFKFNSYMNYMNFLKYALDIQGNYDWVP